MTDYSEHLCALDEILKELRQAMRDKQYSRADALTAQAMSRLARIHGCISVLLRDG